MSVLDGSGRLPQRSTCKPGSRGSNLHLGSRWLCRDFEQSPQLLGVFHVLSYDDIYMYVCALITRTHTHTHIHTHTHAPTHARKHSSYRQQCEPSCVYYIQMSWKTDSVRITSFLVFSCLNFRLPLLCLPNLKPGSAPLFFWEFSAHFQWL